MSIPAALALEGSPYGPSPVVDFLGPQGGPYVVKAPLQQTLLPSVARTASAGSPTQSNPGYKGLYVYWQVTANPGGAQTLAMSIVAVELASGLTVALLSVPASATPGGVFSLYPGLSGAAVEGVSLTRNLHLPSLWFLSVTHSGVGSWTYSVGVDLLP